MSCSLPQLDLLGQNLLTITHEGDRAMLRDQLMPRSQTLGPNGELIIPDEPDGTRKVEEALAHETRRFVIRWVTYQVSVRIFFSQAGQGSKCRLPHLRRVCALPNAAFVLFALCARRQLYLTPSNQPRTECTYDGR